MAKSIKSDIVLGISASTRSIDGVLIQRDGLNYKIRGQFTKARGERGGGKEGEMATLIPGLKSSEEADYTLEIGGAKATSDLFLGNELSDLGITGAEQGDPSGSGGRTQHEHFDSQFRELLSEARKIAPDLDTVALCASVPDVEYKLLQIEDKSDDLTRLISRTTPKTLIRELAGQTGKPVDKDCVGFLEIAEEANKSRYLAVVRDENDPILQTIRIAQAVESTPLPGLAAFDSELSLMAMLLAKDPMAEEGAMNAIVRVGAEDTLIAFFVGSKLLHFDWLRSVNIYDAPETVCSRVLLQQDEKKIGEVSNLLVLANSRSDALHTTFVRYYPDTRVLHYERILADAGLSLEEGGEPLRTGMAMAAAVALTVEDRLKPDSGYINLIPAKLGLKRKRRLELGWHTYLMMPILFLVAFFFMFMYLQNRREIENRRVDLMLNPPAPPVTNPVVLEARVDSLEQAYYRYTRSLQVLDSLLIGSDRWSRFLESVTRSTGALGGVWLTEWDPDGSQVVLNGYALSRSRVSQFARRLDATIESVSSEDIQDKEKQVRIYNFSIVAPIPIELPEVAQYLQEQPLTDPTAN